MLKVKIFSAYSDDELERKINEWLLENDGIRIIATSYTIAAGIIIIHNALVTYKEDIKK